MNGLNNQSSGLSHQEFKELHCRRVNKCINVGEWVLVVLIPIELSAFIVFLSIKTTESDDSLDSLMLWIAKFFGWSFISLSFQLFLTVYFLLSRLCKKRDQITNSQTAADVFNREIRILLMILVIFSVTYITRGVWDLLRDPNPNSFVGLMDSLAIGIINDFAPVMFLMVFHFKNFNKQAEVIEQGGISEERDDKSQASSEAFNMPLVDNSSSATKSNLGGQDHGRDTEHEGSVNQDL